MLSEILTPVRGPICSNVTQRETSSVHLMSFVMSCKYDNIDVIHAAKSPLATDDGAGFPSDAEFCPDKDAEFVPGESPAGGDGIRGRTGEATGPAGEEESPNGDAVVKVGGAVVGDTHVPGLLSVKHE